MGERWGASCSKSSKGWCFPAWPSRSQLAEEQLRYLGVDGTRVYTPPAVVSKFFLLGVRVTERCRPWFLLMTLVRSRRLLEGKTVPRSLVSLPVTTPCCALLPLLLPRVVTEITKHVLLFPLTTITQLSPLLSPRGVTCSFAMPSPELPVQITVVFRCSWQSRQQPVVVLNCGRNSHWDRSLCKVLGWPWLTGGRAEGGPGCQTTVMFVSLPSLLPASGQTFDLLNQRGRRGGRNASGLTFPHEPGKTRDEAAECGCAGG